MFQALVGTGYQTLRSLLLDFCQWQPSEALLDALLDMLVDGKFDLKASPVIKVSSPKSCTYTNSNNILLYLLEKTHTAVLFPLGFSKLCHLFVFQNEDVILLYLSVLQKVGISPTFSIVFPIMILADVLPLLLFNYLLFIFWKCSILNNDILFANWAEQ